MKLRRLTAKNLCPSATVVRVHDLVMRLVINDTGGSRRWLITDTVQLASTRMVVRESVDDTHGSACSLGDSYASATMRVQKLCR